MKIKKITIILTTIILLTSSFIIVESKNIFKNIYPNTEKGNCALFIYGFGGELDGLHTNHNEFIVQRAKNILINSGSWDNSNILEKPDFNTLENYITNIIPENIGNQKHIFIMFACHGNESGFLEMKFDPDTWINPANLADWINTMENNIKNKGINYQSLTIFISACFSGQLIPHLSGEKRIIITSTDANFEAFYDIRTLDPYFTEYFLTALTHKKSFGKAWEYADEKIDTHGNHRLEVILQNPLIDDNGDGIGSGTNQPDFLDLLNDGDLALMIYPLGQPTQDNNPPNTPEIPSGKNKVKINKNYIFTTSSDDIDGDEIYYKWDFGDGEKTDWLGPYISGEECNISHCWDKVDIKYIRARAKDAYGYESEWSPEKIVIVNNNLKSKLTLFNIVKLLFGFFQTL